MTDVDPIVLMYGGLEKLGPGSDDITRLMLEKLPRKDFGTVVDVGCGSGRQTLVLARELDTVVHALDNFAPFLEELEIKAHSARLSDRIQVHCMDMADLARVFSDIDLLWAEGSAYNLGFGEALETWASAMVPGGYLVASELSWLSDQASDRARAFWDAAYPGMGTVAENNRRAREAGYRVLDNCTPPPEAGLPGFYEVFGPRVERLANHEDELVRALATEALEEIEIFQQAGDCYDYVFYILQRG